jgi:hypothetical protein
MKRDRNPSLDQCTEDEYGHDSPSSTCSKIMHFVLIQLPKSTTCTERPWGNCPSKTSRYSSSKSKDTQTLK